MTPAGRSSAATTSLVRLVSGTLLMAAALAALFLLRDSARTSITALSASDAEILVTPVPTVEHVSSLVPSPLPAHPPAAFSPSTLLASLGAQLAPDPPAGMPLSVQAAAPLTIPGPLVDPALPLLAGPVTVPLELHIPVLDIKAPVFGVGLTTRNAMASPIGLRPEDPTWQTVFWYRGGAIPGEAGTATFAGHYDDEIGRPAVFAFLEDIRIGDLIVVQDKRSGLEVPFVVTETRTYTDEETGDPAVLARIFGSSAVSDAESLPASEPVSNLTLITCAGSWINGSFNLHLVVYATRASYPA